MRYKISLLGEPGWTVKLCINLIVEQFYWNIAFMRCKYLNAFRLKCPMLPKGCWVDKYSVKSDCEH